MKLKSYFHEKVKCLASTMSIIKPIEQFSRNKEFNGCFWRWVWYTQGSDHFSTCVLVEMYINLAELGFTFRRNVDGWLSYLWWKGEIGEWFLIWCENCSVPNLWYLRQGWYWRQLSINGLPILSERAHYDYTQYPEFYPVLPFS